eukprot:scaffold541_cov312-Pinguiococcus_pyrenoidosus.AAC.3
MRRCLQRQEGEDTPSTHGRLWPHCGLFSGMMATWKGMHVDLHCFQVRSVDFAGSAARSVLIHGTAECRFRASFKPDSMVYPAKLLLLVLLLLSANLTLGRKRLQKARVLLHATLALSEASSSVPLMASP